MILQIDKCSGTPFYVQICCWLEQEIQEGRLTEGMPLPPERTLSADLGVARNTVKQAYGELCRRGFAETIKGSGSYVKNIAENEFYENAELIIADTLKSLHNTGLTQREIERILLESAWENLPQTEKLQLAWIDCSPEILKTTALEIQHFCNVITVPFSLDDIRLNPYILLERNYHLIATTINHYDDLQKCLQPLLQENQLPAVEMVVLSISTPVISNVARIKKGTSVAVVFHSEWYRYSVECYLKEFGVQGDCKYLSISEALHEVTTNSTKYQLMILPPDTYFSHGTINQIAYQCRHKQIETFTFEQPVDQGSLIYLKKQAQNYWKGLGKQQHDRPHAVH